MASKRDKLNTSKGVEEEWLYCTKQRKKVFFYNFPRFEKWEIIGGPPYHFHHPQKLLKKLFFPTRTGVVGGICRSFFLQEWRVGLLFQKAL